VPQRVLAEALKVTPRAVTGLVDALVADGLVTREPHPGDRRATLVTFTSRGETLVAQLKRDHKALARALFAPMSSRELDGFARGLGGLIDRLCAHLAATGGRSSARPGTQLLDPHSNRRRTTLQAFAKRRESADDPSLP
jgi:predicted ArsR family transcriptional regulator